MKKPKTISKESWDMMDEDEKSRVVFTVNHPDEAIKMCAEMMKQRRNGACDLIQSKTFKVHADMQTLCSIGVMFPEDVSQWMDLLKAAYHIGVEDGRKQALTQPHQ